MYLPVLPHPIDFVLFLYIHFIFDYKMPLITFRILLIELSNIYSELQSPKPMGHTPWLQA